MGKHRLQRKQKKTGNRKKGLVGVVASGRSAGIVAKAISLYQQGDGNSARKILHKVLKRDPDNGDALYTLGLIAKDRGQRSEAIDYFKTTVKFDPTNTHAHFFLGSLHLDNQANAEAAEEYRQVVSLNPSDAEGWYSLGFAISSQGKYEEAITCYEKALALRPGYTNAVYNIGCMRLAQKEYDEAFRWFERTLECAPGYADAWFNKGYIELERKNYAEAICCYEKVIAIDPGSCAAHTNLGLAYHYQNRLDEALACFQKALAINPCFADAHLNMGNTFRQRGELERAAECYQESIDAKPSLAGLNNLCGLKKELCDFEYAGTLSEKILEYENLQKADLATIHDTYIQLCEWDKASAIIDRMRKAPFDPATRDVLAGSFMEFCATTDLSLDEIADLHKQWGALTESEIIPYDHEHRRAERRQSAKLRIAYVSPDLREHSVGYLIKDIITSHNRQEFEIYCYANFNPKDADGFTQEIINKCDVLKYVRHLSDQGVAKEIYEDHIDIVVELAGHTAGHRLRALAYKPAPIQITYLGYPHTTGLSRIDYRITDQFAEYAGKDYRYSERLLRLTHCFLTFKGFQGVSPAPDEKKNEIIFGCFNNIQKLTCHAVKLWARILKAVDRSTLHLKAKQLNTPLVWKNIVREFAKHGISENRLACLGYTPTREEHLKLYNQIDVALDTFPYNGTVTTLEALWMNVPVVTLVGESHAQRVGYSILKNLHLDSLIASTDDEYVSRAVTLAQNPQQIIELKTRMRKNLLASSICNPLILTREVELQLKQIWAAYREFEAESCAEADRQLGARDRMDQVIRAMSTLRMAMVKLETGQPQIALDMSLPLTKHGEVSALAWYVVGVAYGKLVREEDAVEALKNSLAINSNNPGAWKLLGTLYLMKNRIEEARFCLEKTEAQEEKRLGL